MARSCDHEWSPSVATAEPPRAAAAAPAPAAAVAKPKGGARLLSFLIQGAVMAVALALFFLFAGVAALILLHLFVAGRAFRRRRRRRVTATRGAAAAAAADGGVDDGALRGLSPADLRRLPWFEYSPSPWPPPPDCVVCLEGIRARERCRALPPCGHVFHAACVDRWLVKSPACPICRAAVWAAGEEIARAPRRWV